MATFAGGLAFPFFLLALFPAWLKKLPRSGEWLARVKVVMGFLVLAFMLKYLYSLDAVLQTGFLTRERFLAAAFVLLAMAGFYLLGYVRLPGVSADTELGVARLLIGMLFVAGGISLVPGMFGARLGEIEAFIPPPSSDSASSASGGAVELPWMKNDLAGALAKAKAENKLVLADFTGYACTNCKWMKRNMFTRPEVDAVARNMVLVELYTDGADAESQANQKLELDKFQTVAIPFYVVYDGAQNALSTFADKTSDSQQFLSFLNAKPTVAATPGLEGTPFKSLEGRSISTSDWKGKVVVLNYWATWCIPCRQEIPEFNRVHEELASKGVEVVGISMDEDGAEAVKAFLKQIPMKYTVGLGTGSLGQLPVTLVLDRSGNTVQRFEGFTKPDVIRAAIDKALGS
jgi:thiol:disulfide interchange protein DsbD